MDRYVLGLVHYQRTEVGLSIGFKMDIYSLSFINAQIKAAQQVPLPASGGVGQMQAARQPLHSLPTPQTGSGRCPGWLLQVFSSFGQFGVWNSRRREQTASQSAAMNASGDDPAILAQSGLSDEDSVAQPWAARQQCLYETFDEIIKKNHELKNTPPDKFGAMYDDIGLLLHTLKEFPSHFFTDSAFKKFDQVLDGLGTSCADQMGDQFIELSESLQELRTDIEKKEFFPDAFLCKLADAAAAEDSREQSKEIAIELLEDHVFRASDETAKYIVKKLNDITSPVRGLDELKTRLEKFPDVKIPEVCHWIWHGGPPRVEMIENVITFHKMNPGHKMILWADSAQAVESALNAYLAQKGVGTFAERSANVTALRSMLKVRNHGDILTHEAIKEFLEVPASEGVAKKFSKLESIAARNGPLRARAALTS
jgi:hypothetical protein